jgi:hypothetical protein
MDSLIDCLSTNIFTRSVVRTQDLNEVFDHELLLSESSDLDDLSCLTALLPTSTICFTTPPT